MYLILRSQFLILKTPGFQIMQSHFICSMMRIKFKNFFQNIDEINKLNEFSIFLNSGGVVSESIFIPLNNFFLKS